MMQVGWKAPGMVQNQVEVRSGRHGGRGRVRVSAVVATLATLIVAMAVPASAIEAPADVGHGVLLEPTTLPARSNGLFWRGPVVSPDGTLYIWSSGGVRRSIDQGATWTVITTSASAVCGVSVGPGNRLWIQQDFNTAYSDDHGDTLHAFAGNARSGYSCWPTMTHLANGDIVVSEGRYLDLWIASSQKWLGDHGSYHQHIDVAGSASKPLVMPDGSIVMAVGSSLGPGGSAFRGIMRSTDGGRTFQFGGPICGTSTSLCDFYRDAPMLAMVGSTLYVQMNDYLAKNGGLLPTRIYRSTDAGKHWSETYRCNVLDRNCGDLEDSNSDVIYMVHWRKGPGSGGGTSFSNDALRLLRSSNGRDWSEVPGLASLGTPPESGSAFMSTPDSPNVYLQDTQHLWALSRRPLRATIARYFQIFFNRVGTTAEIDAAVTTASTNGSLRSVATQFANSDEWVQRIVTNLYEDALRRAPDSSGLGYWTRKLQNGLLVSTLGAEVYGSSEYFKKFGGGTPAGFVTGLYHDVLHRNPDAGGLAYWTGKVSSRGQVSVAYSFFQSSESRTKRVRDLYLKILCRSADSDGTAYWAGKLLSVNDVSLAISLATSGEFLRKSTAGSCTP